jgi:hypothetical protein
MKNKPYPALLGGSYIFNEIKKRTPKSLETIPLILCISNLIKKGTTKSRENIPLI